MHTRLEKTRAHKKYMNAYTTESRLIHVDGAEPQKETHAWRSQRRSQRRKIGKPSRDIKTNVHKKALRLQISAFKKRGRICADLDLVRSGQIYVTNGCACLFYEVLMQLIMHACTHTSLMKCACN
jgi:hypothetical protein